MLLDVQNCTIINSIQQKLICLIHCRDLCKYCTFDTVNEWCSFKPDSWSDQQVRSQTRWDLPVGEDTHQPTMRDYVEWTPAHLDWLNIYKPIVPDSFMATRDCNIQLAGEKDGMLG